VGTNSCSQEAFWLITLKPEIVAHGITLEVYRPLRQAPSMCAMISPDRCRNVLSFYVLSAKFVK